MEQGQTRRSKRTNGLSGTGGSPLFKRELHVGCPEIGDFRRFLKMAKTIISGRRLTNDGPYVREFEERTAGILGVRHCVAVCSGTMGLELAVRASGLSGEVILPSMTFIATAHALQWQGITPVFCDIDPETLCIDPCQVERLITRKTTGMIGVHLFGRLCQTEALQRIADMHGLKLIFDAAHAFGCSRDQKMAGCFGHAEVLSFHATKFVHSIEGGAVVTNDGALAEKIRLMRNFGFNEDGCVTGLGINGKMNELCAAMGIVSLGNFSKAAEVNRRNYELYQKYLADVPGVELMQYDPQETTNFQYIVVRVNREAAGISRDELLGILNAENILARRYFYPGCHQLEPYRSLPEYSELSLPVSDRLNSELLQLPTGSAVRPRDIKKICGLIGDG